MGKEFVISEYPKDARGVAGYVYDRLAYYIDTIRRLEKMHITEGKESIEYYQTMANVAQLALSGLNVIEPNYYGAFMLVRLEQIRSLGKITYLNKTVEDLSADDEAANWKSGLPKIIDAANQEIDEEKLKLVLYDAQFGFLATKGYVIDGNEIVY
jgi:hypothetical protein